MSLSELKAILKSILITSPQQSLIPLDLYRKFRKEEGYHFPFRNLGFRDFVECLCSQNLSDTVKVEFQDRGPMVFPVEFKKANSPPVEKISKPKFPLTCKESENPAQQSEENLNMNSDPGKVYCFCGLRAKMYTVRKETINQGRQFYFCAQRSDGGCKFVLWADTLETYWYQYHGPLISATLDFNGQDSIVCDCRLPTTRLFKKRMASFVCPKRLEYRCKFEFLSPNPIHTKGATAALNSSTNNESIGSIQSKHDSSPTHRPQGYKQTNSQEEEDEDDWTPRPTSATECTGKAKQEPKLSNGTENEAEDDWTVKVNHSSDNVQEDKCTTGAQNAKNIYEDHWTPTVNKIKEISLNDDWNPNENWNPRDLSSSKNLVEVSENGDMDSGYFDTKPTVSSPSLQSRQPSCTGFLVNCTVQPQEIHKATGKNGMQHLVPITICVANSPSDFYFQLNSEAEGLKSLMNKMNQFYLGTQKHLSPTDIIIGSIYVAKLPPSGKWHRVRALSDLNSGNEVDVFSIDYGHTGKVQCSELRLLHTNFAKMPAQGVHAQLSLKPAEGGEWHPMGRQLFVKLARRFIWSAEVVKIINPKSVQQKVEVLLKVKGIASTYLSSQQNSPGSNNKEEHAIKDVINEFIRDLTHV
nr:PREDICTED: uncharacterized protein LOC109044116 isoform X1 [Bemisia tabaci]XP_018917202.1 PREDICTED: uncharacterized protein LOC109044116 isoform X1 [Bemisia tabaci]